MPSSQSCLPHLKIPTKRPRAALSLLTHPRPEGVSTREKNIREETPASIFHCQWGRAGAGYRGLLHLAVPWQNPHHSLFSSHLSTSNNPWALGKGATVPVPGQILREYSGLSDQDWHETGGSRVEATDMRSLLGEGEQRLSVFSALWRY